MILAKNDTYGYMGKGNYASNIRKLEKSYKSGLTKPNMEGGDRFDLRDKRNDIPCSCLKHLSLQHIVPEVFQF